MVTIEEVESRYRRALAELDTISPALDAALKNEVVGYQAAVSRVHVAFEAVRAHLWAAELGLRILQDQRAQGGAGGASAG